MITVRELTEDQLVAILTETRTRLPNNLQNSWRWRELELEFSPDALRELAGPSMKKGTGARALRGLAGEVMLD